MFTRRANGTMAVAVLSLLFFTGGCAEIPKQEFKSYTSAFDEVKENTDRFLVDMAEAKTIADAAKPKKEDTSAAPSPAPFPLTLTLSSASVPDDPIEHRRAALEVVMRFNTALTNLAEGRSPEEVKSSVQSLAEGLKNLSGLVGASIPALGPFVPLISTVVGELEKAANREQFKNALRAGEPVIDGILQLFAKDAQDVYAIRALDAIRRSGRAKRKLTSLVRQMRSVAAEHDKPADDNVVKKLDKLEERIAAALNTVGAAGNSSKLETTVGGKKFDTIALSQLEQTLDQVEKEAANYQAVVAEQQAYNKLMVSYGELLTQANAALRNVRTALDRPADIRAQAMSLISFAFAVKRDWETLQTARRAASGT